MTTPPAPQLIDGHLVISSSWTNAVRRCPTYARYKYVDKRERTGAVAKGREPGKAFHAALETLYKGAPDGALGKALPAAQDALAASYDGIELVEGDEHLTLARMSGVLDGYVNGCRVELGKDGKNGIYTHPGHQQEPFESLSAEMAFAVRLGEVRLANEVWEGSGDFDPKQVPVIYLGYTDLVTRWHERGEVMVLDTKTSRRWDSSNIVKWRMAGGPKGYAACIPQWMEEGIDGLPASIRESLLPYEDKRKQLVAAGIKRIDGFVLNAVVVRPSTDLVRCKSAPTEYHRELVYYTDQHLAEWRENTLRWARTWLEWSAAGAWPMNDDACASYYGRCCPFECVCSLPPGQREMMLSTDMFQDVTRGYLKEKADAANGEN